MTRLFQLVEGARAAITDPSWWCRFDESQSRCSAFDPRAPRYCAVSALHRVALRRVGNRVEAADLAQLAADVIPVEVDGARTIRELAFSNDYCGLAAVCSAFEQALARLSAMALCRGGNPRDGASSMLPSANYATGIDRT